MWGKNGQMSGPVNGKGNISVIAACCSGAASKPVAAFSPTRMDDDIRVTWAPSLSRHLMILFNHVIRGGKDEHELRA